MSNDGIMQKKTNSLLMRISKIGAVWLSIFAIAYLLMESLFFCCTSYLFPYAARPSFGFGIYPLLQTSKKGTEPKDYVAIFGDSFGFGAGDYFQNNQGKINPKFNVTHFLHDATHRDFVSFAIPGSSNLCDWIEDPIASINYINSTYFYHIEEPKDIFLYFYEGNDMQDNYTDLQSRYIANKYNMESMSDKKYFSAFIDTEMLNKNKINMSARSMTWGNNFFLFKYINNSRQESINRQKILEYMKKIKIPVSGEINKILINNLSVSIPDNLQSPPVEMQPEAIKVTLKFLSQIAAYVKDQYPRTRISIIYIPSTTTSYKLASNTVSIYNPEFATVFPTKAVIDTSNQLCAEIQKIAIDNSFNFYDTRAGIQAKGQKELLHGPMDWRHLNLAGYTALSNELYRFMQLLDNAQSATTVSSCAQL